MGLKSNTHKITKTKAVANVATPMKETLDWEAIKLRK